MINSHLLQMISESLLNRERGVLNFSLEGERYLHKLKFNRSKSDYQLIQKFRKKIRFNSNVKTITAIPAHIEEVNLNTVIQSYSRIKKDLKNNHIIIFLNANRKISKQEYTKNLKRQMQVLQECRTRYKKCKFTVLTHYFNNFSMGRIRGVLTDAIVAAALDAGLKNPLLISNDADILHVSNNYLNEISEYFRNNKTLEAIRCPIIWGFEHRDANGKIPTQLILPELFLNAESLYRREHYRHKQIRISGLMRPLSGANSIYRLAAYCAIGGYDYGLTQGEDCELGWRLQYMHRAIDCNYKKSKILNYVSYYSKPFVIISSRRAMHSILSNHIFEHQWKRFSTQIGARLSFEKLKNKYLKSKKHLQWTDIELARLGNKKAIKKIQKRINKIFLNSITSEKHVTRGRKIKILSYQWNLVTTKDARIIWNKSPLYLFLIGKKSLSGLNK